MIHVLPKNYRLQDPVLAFLIGLFWQTLLIGVLVLLGLPISWSIIIFLVVYSICMILFWKIVTRPFFEMHSRSWTKPRLYWYEQILILLLCIQLFWGLFCVINTPLYFSDAVHHWGARAKHLYYGVNWSTDPAHPYFLGVGARQYPLGRPIWQCEIAFFAQQWNDIIPKFDGLFFFYITAYILWAGTFAFSCSRFLACFVTILFSSLPLTAWHMVSGFSDLGTAMYVTAAAWMLLHKKWFLCGVCLAASAWIKNDSFIIYTGPFLVAVFAYSYFGKPFSSKNLFRMSSWKHSLEYLAGLLTLFPWLALRQFYKLRVTPYGETDVFGWRPDAPKLFWDRVLDAPTSNAFWIIVIGYLAVRALSLWKDRTGRMLLTLFVLSYIDLFVIFSFTPAYDWLKYNSTVNRSMLQFYGITLFTLLYAIHLHPRISSSLRDDTVAGDEAIRDTSPPPANA